MYSSLARAAKAMLARMIYSAVPHQKKESSVPLYEYKCLKCGRKTEKIENVNGPHLKKCPHCGGKVEAMFSAPAIQFKGSGWYVTDYGGKKSSGDSGKDDKPATESKDAGKDSAAKDSSAKDSGSKEKKSEKSEKSEKSGKSEKSEKKK
jgi:putative FmdB family regulatory protein